MPIKQLSREQLIQPFQPPIDLIVQKLPLSLVEIKGFNPKDRTYEAFITAQITDRDNEGILVDGIDLTQYSDTPVVGWVHFFDRAIRGFVPIGGTIDLRKEIHPKYNVSGLVAKVQLLDENSEFMNTLIKCLEFKPKPILAESVGFIPKQWTSSKPFDTQAQWDDAERWAILSVLLEHSLCPVVSNFASTPKIKSYLTSNEMVAIGIERYLIDAVKTMVIFDKEVLAGLDLQGETYKPYPNEHSCRLRDPGDFQSDTFRRMKREHEGKEYSVILGKLKDETTMTEQAYRYGKKIWTEAEAKAHCESHNGISFEPASESSDFTIESIKTIFDSLSKLQDTSEVLSLMNNDIGINDSLLKIQEALKEAQNKIKTSENQESKTFLTSMAEKLNK